jgi:hypothetical protein
MNLKFWILILLANFSVAQTESEFLNDFVLQNELQAENKLIQYQTFDFSKLWTNTSNDIVFGIIGQEHQRVRIKLLSVLKNSQSPTTYKVEGKSMVKENICEFTGTIEIKAVREMKEFHYGVDNKFKDFGILQQGIIIADYNFDENLNQNHSGTFSGKLYSKWYLDGENNIIYDDILIVSDGYYNNAFVGVWKSHKTGNEKICNWADWRVPNANSDFDVGAGEFSVSEKYWNKGWMDIALKNQVPNGAIVREKSDKKTKEWWE